MSAGRVPVWLQLNAKYWFKLEQAQSPNLCVRGAGAASDGDYHRSLASSGAFLLLPLGFRHFMSRPERSPTP